MLSRRKALICILEDDERFRQNRYECFVGRDSSGRQVRYNFNDPNVLKYEVRSRDGKWETKEAQDYGKVQVVLNELILKEKEEKETKIRKGE